MCAVEPIVLLRRDWSKGFGQWPRRARFCCEARLLGSIKVKPSRGLDGNTTSSSLCTHTRSSSNQLSQLSAMSSNTMAASSTPFSVVAGGKILDLSAPIEEWRDAEPQVTDIAVNPFSEQVLYLSLYDLCRGDIALLDAIRGPEVAPPMPPTPIAVLNTMAPLQVPVPRLTSYNCTHSYAGQSSHGCFQDVKDSFQGQVYTLH
jgi:hypothetical protein